MKLCDALDLVDSFRDLGPGWDSYQGKLISLKAIDKAKELLVKLGDGYQPVPCGDGGIQIERHADGFDIEILIDES